MALSSATQFFNVYHIFLNNEASEGCRYKGTYIRYNCTGKLQGEFSYGTDKRILCK